MTQLGIILWLMLCLSADILSLYWLSIICGIVLGVIDTTDNVVLSTITQIDYPHEL